MKQTTSHSPTTRGFTIVEILIVIVVIGILAALVTASYAGIQQKAYYATLQSDMKQAVSTLKIDFTINDKYPATADDAAGGKGLAASPGTEYQYSVDNPSKPLSFCLTGTNHSYTLRVQNNGLVEEGACTGHFLAGQPRDASDDFNRVGSSLGTTTTGELAWEALSGTWSTNGSRAVLNSSSNASPLAAVTYGSTNADVGANINVNDAIYFRVKDSNNWWRLREKQRTESYTYYTSEPYTYYTYSYSAGSWSASSGFCEDSRLYPSTGTYYSNYHSPSGLAQTKSVHGGVGSGGCGNAYGWPGTGFHVQYYGRQIYTNSTPQTGYQQVAHTGYNYYYSLVLEKSVNDTITQVWAQPESGSRQTLARAVVNGDSIAVYDSLTGSALKTVSDSYNNGEVKFGIGRAINSTSGSAIDNFALKGVQ